MGDFSPEIGSRAGKKIFRGNAAQFVPVLYGSINGGVIDTSSIAAGGGLQLETRAIYNIESNTAFGISALLANTTGTGNSALGFGALIANTSGSANAAFGVNSLKANTTGTQNMGFGNSALANNTTGSGNCAVGQGVLIASISASYNTAIGFAAGFTVTGSSNTIIGSAVASLTLTTGTGNILIGTSNAIDTPASGTNNWLNIGGAIVGSLTGTINYLASSTNDSAAAGSIGEYISSTILVGSAVALTSATPANITSVSLTAGDWDVNATIAFNPNGTAAQTICQAGVSTTTGTLPTAPGAGAFLNLPVNLITGDGSCHPVGTTRISLASTTTVYLVASTTFTGVAATVGGYGFLGARRAR